LLNRRDSLHYRYWLEIYLLWAAPSLEESGYVSLMHTLSVILHSDVLKNMVHRAGLRAQILESGIIKVSEEVSDKQPDQVLNRIPLRNAGCKW